MAKHEALSYANQVEARGLLEVNALNRAFSKMSRTYRHYLRGLSVRGPALDVACGYGNFLYFLRDLGIEARGVDLDPSQVALCRSLGLCADARDALLEIKQSSSLGLISALDFIEHLDKDGAVEFLQDSHAALLPGGHLILRLPSADGPFGAHDFANDMTHKWIASANVIEGLLKATGFRPLSVHDDYPAPVHAKGVLRFVSYQIAKRLLALPVIALGMSPPRIWTRSMWAVAVRD